MLRSWASRGRALAQQRHLHQHLVGAVDLVHQLRSSGVLAGLFVLPDFFQARPLIVLIAMRFTSAAVCRTEPAADLQAGDDVGPFDLEDDLARLARLRRGDAPAVVNATMFDRRSGRWWPAPRSSAPA